MTSVFQGLSLSRSVGWVGENPGNEVVTWNEKEASATFAIQPKRFQ